MTDSLFIPVPLVSYRLYSINNDYVDYLTETDDDLRDKTENDIYYDYDTQTDVSENISTKRGFLADAISIGKELQLASGAIKNFTFHLISPILQSLKNDSNSHALKELCAFLDRHV